MRRLVSLVALLLALSAACSSDDGGSVTTEISASGSASVDVEAEPLPAECVVRNGIIAKVEQTMHARLDERAVSLDRTTVPAGVVELRAENRGTATHALSIVDTTGHEVGGFDPFPPGVECPGHFELDAGQYRVRWANSEAVLTITPARPSS